LLRQLLQAPVPDAAAAAAAAAAATHSPGIDL
jgi:hypothetical protein